MHGFDALVRKGPLDLRIVKFKCKFTIGVMIDMDFEYSKKTKELLLVLQDFMDEYVIPNEQCYRDQISASGNPHSHPPIMETLKAEARSRGLWNLFLPDPTFGAGLTNLEYAPLAELSGWSPIAPEAMNCAAPDTGNMEILSLFGTQEQKDRWLIPLLEGRIRSCFSMTEPEVASSDATNIRTRIVREGNELVINGHKWFTSGASRESCRFAIVMGVHEGDAQGSHHGHSMVIVLIDTPGVEIERTLTVFGNEAQHGHCEVFYRDARVPISNLLGKEGDGFAISQARLGPGRIHHSMRAIGMAERALSLMCRRAHERSTFGKPLAEQGVVQDWIAESRMMIEQTRLMVLKTAWLMDTVGNRGARTEISAIKVMAARTARWVVDRAIQVHGAAGVTQDLPLAHMFTATRTMQIADGPDEVHKRGLALRELRQYEHSVAGS